MPMYMVFSPHAFRLVVLTPILIWVAWKDLRSSLIPNTACLLLLALGLAMPAVEGWDVSWGEAMGAATLIFCVTFVLYLLGQGAGDAKLLTGLASVFGYSIIVVAALAYLLAGVAAVALLLAKRITRQSRIPLAPAIALSCWSYLLFIILRK